MFDWLVLRLDENRVVITFLTHFGYILNTFWISVESSMSDTINHASVGFFCFEAFQAGVAPRK